jgi:hypothetical protein
MAVTVCAGNTVQMYSTFCAVLRGGLTNPRQSYNNHSRRLLTADIHVVINASYGKGYEYSHSTSNAQSCPCISLFEH